MLAAILNGLLVGKHIHDIHVSGITPSYRYFEYGDGNVSRILTRSNEEFVITLNEMSVQIGLLIGAS